jgi:hypothetical protein
MPVIGFLDAVSAPKRTDVMAAFRQGFAEAGYAEGQNVAVDIAGRKVDTIGCQSWRPTSFAVE